MNDNIAQNNLPGDGETIKAADFAPLTQPHKKRGARLKPLHFVLGGTLSILAVVALFLFSAKSVFINTEPAASNISINGGIKFKLGDGYLLLTDTYQVTASVEGYYPLDQPFTVGDASNQQFNFELRKLPGKLLVQGPENAAAQIWIDGERRGSLNELIADVDAGEHEIRIVSERYQPYLSAITIEGLNKEQTFEPDLEPAWANVTINSDPEGAQLIVDGETVGTTPLIAEILEGEREFTIDLAGFKMWRNLVDVEAGRDFKLELIELERAGGTVKVTSTPSGASVTVNGNYMGQTPTTLSLSPGRDYRFTLFKDGFQSVERRLDVATGDARNLDLTLAAKLGRIKIDSNPADAELYINGRLMGRANQVLTLPSSQTEVVIKKEGYVDYKTVILPQPELEQLIPITLKTVEEFKWERIPTKITTVASQELKLFRPNATFTMGSSRREQGRRANESQLEVALTRPFYFGIHEVSNRQYREFIEKHNSSNVKGVSLNNDDMPAVQISWEDAAKYCNWLSEQEGLPLFYRIEKKEKEEKVVGFNPQSNGYRLPTEAEWAWTARYVNGQLKKYGWGEDLPPAEKSANIADRSAANVARYVIPSYNDGYAASAPIGSFLPNANGIYDLDGNVAEWVNDFYDVNSALAREKFVDPLGPSDGSYHVIRGSSWSHATITELRLAYRDYGIDAREDLGFRVARFVD